MRLEARLRRRAGRCFLSCRGYALRRGLIRLSLCCVVVLGWGSVLEGHVSVSGWWVGASPLLLSRRNTLWVCVWWRVLEYMTPKTAIFSDLDYFFVDYLFN